MQPSSLLLKVTYVAVILATGLVVIGIFLLLQTKQVVYEQRERVVTQSDITPFPISVDPINQTISDSSSVEAFYEQLAQETIDTPSWLQPAVAVLSRFQWYQQLASPVSRIVVLWPGERTEEAAKNIGDVLRWNATEREAFIAYMKEYPPYVSEGAYLPGQYVTHRYATPEDISLLLHQEFQTAVLDRYSPDIARKVPLEEALIIASMIEREASDFSNMREVSGVIWNRIFLDMPLQLDATLQYIKGSMKNQSPWWPIVRPKDKFLDSPYNTYQYSGLPPGPIANPSVEAILATLNPVVTDCIYYFHGPDKAYYCSVTYEEHVEKLQAVYDQGS